MLLDIKMRFYIYLEINFGSFSTVILENNKLERFDSSIFGKILRQMNQSNFVLDKDGWRYPSIDVTGSIIFKTFSKYI